MCDMSTIVYINVNPAFSAHSLAFPLRYGNEKRLRYKLSVVPVPLYHIKTGGALYS